MSEQSNLYRERFRGHFVPRGEPLDHHSNDEQHRRDRRPPPAMHYDPNNPRPRRYDENAAEHNAAESSRRSHYSRPQRENPITGSPSTRAAAASNPAPRRQPESDPVRPPLESDRTSQRQPHRDEPNGGRSVAHGTTRSSSTSRRTRDASVRDPGGRQYSRHVLPYVGGQPGVEVSPGLGPPYPTSLSMSGSPPRRPSDRRYDHFERQQHDYRAPRSDVYERDGWTERYDHASRRTHRREER